MSGFAPAPAIELAAEQLRRGRAMEVTVHGESMWPLVRAGDRVRLDPGIRPARGRLAAVLVDGHLVVHRIVGLGRTCVLLGDHGGRPLVVAPADLLGIVTRQWTRTGRLVHHERRRTVVVGWLVSQVTPLTRWPWRAARRGRARLRRKGQ